MKRKVVSVLCCARLMFKHGKMRRGFAGEHPDGASDSTHPADVGSASENEEFDGVFDATVNAGMHRKSCM